MNDPQYSLSLSAARTNIESEFPNVSLGKHHNITLQRRAPSAHREDCRATEKLICPLLYQMTKESKSSWGVSFWRCQPSSWAGTSPGNAGWERHPKEMQVALKQCLWMSINSNRKTPFNEIDSLRCGWQNSLFSLWKGSKLDFRQKRWSGIACLRERDQNYQVLRWGYREKEN